MVTGCPLAPLSELAVSIAYGGIPGEPGAVLGPNSKTTRSKPGLCAIRMAISCAWLAAEPPVTRGHAAAGVEPGPGVGVGAGVAVGAAVGVGLARRVVAGGLGEAEGEREADVVGGAGDGEGRAAGPAEHALTTTMPSAMRTPK